MKVKGLNWAGRSFLLPLVIGLLLLTSVVKNSVADTNVSGYITSDTTWTKANSPYVAGNVIVNSGVTLTIEQGATVKFSKSSALTVKGTLVAKGTNSENITFTKYSSDNWGYILFDDSSTDAILDSSENYSSGSIMEYCVIEYAGGTSVSDNGAVRMNNAHPFINYCTIQNNSASGIYAYSLSGTLQVKNSAIKNNTSSSYGAGIYTSGGTVKISGNTISGNTTLYYGGGIYSNSTATISNNTISSNTASSYGGGGICSGSTATISNNTISGNTTGSDGGGIYSYSTATISNNTISGNTASQGGGISSATATISNNTINGNTASIGGGIYSGTGTISNNIISKNTAKNGGGIYNYGTSVISMNTIAGNTATDASAIYNTGSNTKDFTYNTITGNKATNTNSYTLYISSFPNFNYCNLYSNTATYEFYNANSQGSGDPDAKNNWWGTTNDSDIQSRIYDGIDDSTISLVVYSPYESAIRTDCPISPPTGLTATAGTNYINLSWTANSESDTKGYKVYWDTDSGHSYANTVDVGNVTSYTITSLTGSKYYVTVTAYDTSYSSASDDTSTIVNENMTNGNESWYADETTVTFSSDTTPPTVSSTSPSNGATGVAVDTSVTATFSEAMDSATISTSTFTMSGGMTGTVSYDSTTKTATFTPTSKLSYATTYTATITTGVKDSVGNAMSSNYTWSFTTTSGPDTTAPTGSININSSAVYTKSASVTLALSATDGVGVTGYYLSESSATPLASASGWTTVSSTTSYSASISYTLSSGDGNKTVYVWYKDAAGNVSSSASDTITLDTTDPTITITSPTSDATYTTTISTISLGGSASDITSGVSSVTWSSGTASGTTSWSISSVSLSSGDNVITVTATDEAGNAGTDKITVTYSGQTQDIWPGFKKDIRHTGRTSYKGPSNPAKKWSYPVNMEEWPRVGPSIDSSGVIYFGTGKTEHSLYAIYPDGTLKWTYSWSISDPSCGVPAIYNDETLYLVQLGRYESDWAGRIHALNSDSTLKWSYKVSSASGPWMEASASVDTDGTIYIPDYSNSPYSGGVSAINPDGTLKWYYGISTSGSERDSKSTIAIDDSRGHLYFGASHKSGDNRIIALDREGKFLWDYTTGGPIPESPAIGDDGTVYFGSRDGKLYALDPNGNYKWSFTTNGEIDFSPVIGWDGTVYVGSNDKFLYAINSDGTKKWSFETGSSLYGAAAIDGDDNVYFGSSDKYFYSLTSDGILRWKFLTEGKIESYPAIGKDETIYFSSLGGNLYALNNSVSTPIPTPSPTPSPSPTLSPCEGTIYGFVKDEDDLPLKNVLVTLTGSDNYTGSTKTDEDGYYIFEELSSGDYTLEASKSGYQAYTENLHLEPCEELEVETNYLEETPCGSIYGYVVNINGDPVENARLKLRGLRKVKHLKDRAVSDKDGFFEFSKCLDAGKYVITVNKKRYRPAQKTVEIEEGEEKDIGEIVLKRKSTKMKMLSEEEAE